MKKIAIFFSLVFFSILQVSSQKLSVGAGYQYLYSAEWDKAIQTYNFTRPFLEENQPLLAHGTYLEVNYLFSLQKKLRSGIKLNHSFTRSRAEATDFNVSLHLHQLELGYILQYAFSENSEGIILEFTPSALGTRLSRRVNEEIDEIDGENNVAYGIGANIGLTALYGFELNEGIVLMPFAGIAYSPYLFSPKSGSVLNQTIIDRSVQVFSFKLGARITF